MTHANPDVNNWQIVEERFDPDNATLYETLFALGNGALGMRATFEEGLPGAGTEGTFINGFYETAPIVYGEKFIGYAEHKQTILNLANAKVIRLKVGEEDFHLRSGTVLDYRRALDLRSGVLRRSLRWRSPQGREVQIEVERLVHQTRQRVAAVRYQVTPLNFTGPLTLFSGIDGAIRQSEHAEDDPRLGTQFRSEVLRLEEKGFRGGAAVMRHRTVTTRLGVACGIRHALSGEGEWAQRDEARDLGYEIRVQARQGETVTLEKFIAYASTLETAEETLTAAVLDELASAAEVGFDALAGEQRDFMTTFWQAADVTIEGDDLLQRGIRFNMFHLLQSAGRDGRTAIAAKGLTGLGYEGHFFWDTEIYVLPFFLYTQPEIARKLLEYRYHILDKARERAREMSHKQGALYAWRTIDGAECSANFPTGTAQYHINADIAFAIRRYYDASQDADFMQRCGVEMLVETARLWMDVGAYTPAKGGRFCINGVTGPDEYQILVNNNAYTNLMARENLRFASEMTAWLKETDASRYAALAEKIALQESEPDDWGAAAAKMYVPYDETRGIIAQDDTFLSKAVWDFTGTPRGNYPLLLHYHPLVVMRYQVCKQADTVLAEFLLHDQFERTQKERDYAYYEPLTTHDSSLSTAIFGIVAAELGDVDKAYRYFVETATMDLENKHANTEAGIHAANMAGAWQGIVYGFAGMRAQAGLSFNPVIPKGWRAYAFKLRYRGRLIGVRVTAGGAQFTLLEGEPMEIRVGEEQVRLG